MSRADLTGLHDALRMVAGMPVDVEVHERLLVVRAGPATEVLIARRAQVLQLARRHGFSHACVEVT